MKRSTLPSDDQAEIEQFVSEQFAFLVGEKGFHPGPIERVRAGYTNISYLSEQIGFEIYIEFRDPTVNEGLINVRANTDPIGDNPTALQPRLKRPFFGALLNTLGVTDKRIDQVYALERTKQPWDNQVFKGIISLVAELVRDYIDALAALPTEELFPPQTPKAKR